MKIMNINFVKKIVIGFFALIAVLDLIFNIKILNRLSIVQADINGIEWDVNYNVESLTELKDNVDDIKYDVDCIKSDVSDIEYYFR